MRLYFHNPTFYYYLIAVVAGILCFVNLGGHPIYILDEAKNAEAAREMFVNNDWLVPTFNGELRTDKPPLHYWFMIVAYKLFGVSAFSARFFSAVFGVLTIVSTYHFTKKFIGKTVGLITSFVLCSAIFFVQEFHLAVPDPYLIFFVSFALFHFFDFYQKGKFVNWLIFYISFGFGFLAKGPIAVLLPSLVIFLFLLFKKDFNLGSLLKINPLVGLLITTLVAAPWFYLVHLETDGAFTSGFFLEHNFQRFSSEMEGHGGLPVITWAFVLLGLLPFSFFIVQGFVQGWKQKRQNDFILFSFVVSSVFVLFFSFSGTKLPNYTMPAYPFIGVLLAFYLNRVLNKNLSEKAYKISLWVLFGLTLLMPIGGYIALSIAEKQLYPVRFVSIFLLILPLGCILSLIYLRQKKVTESILAIGLSAMLLSMGLFSFVYPKLVEQSPVVKAKQVMTTDTNAILYKGFDPAFLFNFQRCFPFSDKKAEVLNFSNSNPETVVITKEKFYLQDWENVKTEVLMKQKALFENYTIIIFKIHE